MGKKHNLIFLATFLTGCFTSSGQACSVPTTNTSWCSYKAAPTSPTTATATTTIDEPEHDTLAFVTVNGGVFAVASVRSADEVRVYRVEPTDERETPIVVTLVGKMRFDDASAPEHVTADRNGHALVALADGTIATIDPMTMTRGSDAPRDATKFVNAMSTLGDTSAYVDDGDAYAGNGDTFARVGAPGLTRAAALADVGEHALRVIAVQTEAPRMLVFFSATDTTMPIAFEPLE